MAKRFTDSDKWKDGWYMSLNNDERIAWQYLLDNCTIAGRWKINIKSLNFHCNSNFSKEQFEETFKGRVFFIQEGEYYFIPKFLKFQYSTGLNSSKPAIISVRKELIQYDLVEIVQELFGNDYLTITERLPNDSRTIRQLLPNDLAIIKDKDKDKYKDKDKDKATIEESLQNDYNEYLEKIKERDPLIAENMRKLIKKE